MIESEDIERLKDIFVPRSECNTTTDEINRKLVNDNTKLALIEQQVNTILWLSKTTLAGVVTAIVGAVMALILR